MRVVLRLDSGSDAFAEIHGKRPAHGRSRSFLDRRVDPPSEPADQALAGGDASCAAYDPDFPACVDGECLECATNDHCADTPNTPICDHYTHTCLPCHFHAQCPASACDLETGACFPTDSLYYVNGTTGSDTNSGLTEDLAFETIGRAIDEIGSNGTGVIRIADVVGTYAEQLLLQGGGTKIALLGEGLPRIADDADVSLLVVTGATIYLHGLSISLGADSGIDCSNGTLWIDNSTIHGNAGSGVIIGASCDATIRNSMISGHGGVGATTPEITNAGSLLLSYSSVGGGGAAGGTADALECSGGSTTVSNAILIGAAADQIDCPGADIQRSALDDADFASGTNVDVGALQTDWFVNYASGDLHLTDGVATDIFDALAIPQPDDIPVDADGDPRPDPGYAGADQL